MPKKGKKAEKTEEPELELAEALKEHEKTEESELEEDVDDVNLNLQALEFHQLMQLQEGTEAGAPVLERIAGSQPRPIFVGGIPQGPATANTGEESRDEFKYMPGAETGNEPKYLGPPEAVRGTAERVRFEDIGRRQEFFPQINQESFVEGASEIRGMGFQQQATERFERAERFDVERAGRRDVFERPEAKYEKYKPKLPRSS